MKKRLLSACIFTIAFIACQSQTLVFHDIQRDTAGNLIPWYNPSHSSTYNHVLDLIWNFWKNIPTDAGGHKYYMIDHSYNNPLSGNKVGGDQFAMALSSWGLYYAYTGDTDLIENMVYIADYYMSHSLSNTWDSWPEFPYPCNYTHTSGANYDGDYVLGADITQPDKAGSFAYELVTLYKITGNISYLNAAVKIANVLADKVQPGDASNSPYPFKVYATNGNLAPSILGSNFSANVVPTLQLFENLKNLNMGNIVKYDTATAKLIRWVKQYPLQNNNWGCFFEDIPVGSNTEINAVTMAMYILQHPGWSTNYLQNARAILDWTFTTFQSHAYDTLGVSAIYEQSVDLKEGGSHTSRYASIELLYSELTGDTSKITRAIRELDWATYLCDTSGLCRFSPREGSAWYTDGYGDYVRHFLRAMAAYPAIAPDSSNHLLRTTSVITYINYQPHEIMYHTFDSASLETLRLTSKPAMVMADGNMLGELGTLSGEGWTWTPYPVGGVLKVRHDNARAIDILWQGASVNDVAGENMFNIYPNPATDRINVVCSRKPEGGVMVAINDIAGKKVFERELNTTGALEINTEGFTPGVYFVKLLSPNGQSVKKVVIAGR